MSLARLQHQIKTDYTCSCGGAQLLCARTDYTTWEEAVLMCQRCHTKETWKRHFTQTRWTKY